jgi:PTH1 family peptidyl-tRNA hydrolase
MINLLIKTVMIKAIIGLGNPGPRFTNTRHNIGFLVLDKLAELNNLDFKEKSLSNNSPSMITALDGIELIKPLTYMNDSGKVIQYLFKKGVKPHEIIVIHDEMEKKLGTVSSRIGGSARGHNGLKSIINFGAGECWRIRCGIDRPINKEDVPDYVLSNFENQEIIEKLTDAAIKEIYQILEKP